MVAALQLLEAIDGKSGAGFALRFLLAQTFANTPAPQSIESGWAVLALTSYCGVPMKAIPYLLAHADPTITPSELIPVT